MAWPAKSAGLGGGGARSTASELAKMIGPSVGVVEEGELEKEHSASSSLCPVEACIAAAPAKKEPSLAFKVAVVSAAFVAAVFLLSSMKLLYEQPDHFRYPLFLTAFHQIFAMIVSGLFLRLTGRQVGARDEFAGARSPARRELGLRGRLSRLGCPVRTYWRRFASILAVVGPVAFFGATCVACANTALLYIYPSLHEMIQNLGPLWVIVVGKIVKPKQRHNLWTYVSLVPVFLGGALCISGEIGSFSLMGIAISNFAALSRSLRLVAQERVFQGVQAASKPNGKEGGGPRAKVIGMKSPADSSSPPSVSGSVDEEAPIVAKSVDEAKEPRPGERAELGADDIRRLDSLTLLYYTAPFNFVLFLVYSICYEDLFGFASGKPFSEGQVYEFLTMQLGGSTYFYFFFTGLIASVFNLLAFMQVELVGGFVCSMVAQLKTPANILTSWLVFGAPCTYQQMLGVLLVCLGLQAYNKYGETISPAPATADAKEHQQVAKGSSSC